MEHVFAKVLDMSVTASLVIPVVLALRLLLRKAPKVYSYALWSVVLFRLLCPVSFESEMSIIPDGFGYTPAQETVGYETVTPEKSFEEASETVAGALTGGRDIIPTQDEAVGVERTTVGQGSVLLLCSRLWPVGMAVMAGYSLYALAGLRRRLKNAAHLQDNIYEAGGLETAFVLGLSRPKIYLPAGLTEAERPYIIRHEQYHIRRFDHIIKILAFAALCIHWFNPLVWLAFVLAGKDMEMSCDEAVIRAMGEGIRADYSASLLALATGRHRIAATPLAFGEGDPKGRIQNVLNWKKPKVWVRAAAAVVCVAAVAVCAANPQKLVDTSTVTRIQFDGLMPIQYEDGTGVEAPLVTDMPDEAKKELLDLLDSSTGRASKKELQSGYDYFVWLACEDESGYGLTYWKQDAVAVLTYRDNSGEKKGSWTMEDKFVKGFAQWLEKWYSVMEQVKNGDSKALGEYYWYRRGLDFEELKPGEVKYLGENIVLTQDHSAVEYQITYSRTGLTVQVGLIAEDGAEYSDTFEGGSSASRFENLPAGRYYPFVRNVEDTSDYRTDVSPNATGVVNFDLTSDKDCFQSTASEEVGSPLVQETPIHISAYDTLHQAILDHHRSSQSGQYFCCENYIVLANEEGTRMHPITGEDMVAMNYYLWVLYQEYLFTDEGIVDMGGAHIPTNITLMENGDGSWSVLNYWEPRDGSYYVEDIQTIFPADSVADALDSQKFIYSQVQDCYAQAVEYAKTDSDVNLDTDQIISDLLDVVCSSPMESSNPKDYVADHPIEYRELKYYGNYTREYCTRHLENMGLEDDGPTEYGLRERIMEMLLGELNL